MNSAGRIYYHFGSFQLDVGARLLLQEGAVVPLTPKIFETLLLLLQANGKIVEREQLIHTVWHDSYIEEGNISSTIYLLRKALGDNRNGQNYIATVSRRGYRFLAPVKEVCEAAPQLGISPPGGIAVLPFSSLSHNDHCYELGLGLADALITKLSNYHTLTVRPTNVIRKYAGVEIDYVQVGHELGIDLLVECNFQHIGEVIRVTAQLISAREAVLLWAATYDESFTDIFTVEDAVSTNIADDLWYELCQKKAKNTPRQMTDVGLIQPLLPTALYSDSVNGNGLS